MAKVVSIKKIGFQNVYDLGIGDNHNYIAGNIIVHNCMAVPMILAGFTPTEADNFRKGIKQKDSEKFKIWEEKFIKGCKTYSKIDNKLAKKIWDEINAWAGYGFNKSHSATYAVIGYITAWLKTFYPVQFMTALMSYNVGADDKLNLYLRDAKKMGLKLMKPSINISGQMFLPLEDKIVYPLSIIKNVGDKAVVDIIKNRKKKGRYKSFEDFYSRITKRVVNVRVIINLILAGCFRKFGTTQQIFDKFIELSKEKGIRSVYCTKCKFRYPISISAKVAKENGCACPECGSIEVITDPTLVRGKAFNTSYCNNIVFGVTVDDVLKPYLETFIKYDVKSMKEATDCSGEILFIGAMVTEIRKHVDKNGNEMAFMKIFDGLNTYDLIVFSYLWDMFKLTIKKNGVYIFRVKVDGEKFLLYKPYECKEDYMIVKKLTP